MVLLSSPEHHAEARYLISCLSVDGVFHFPTGQEDGVLSSYGRGLGLARFLS